MAWRGGSAVLGRSMAALELPPRPAGAGGVARDVAVAAATAATAKSCVAGTALDSALTVDSRCGVLQPGRPVGLTQRRSEDVGDALMVVLRLRGRSAGRLLRRRLLAPDIVDERRRGAGRD